MDVKTIKDFENYCVTSNGDIVSKMTGRTLVGSIKKAGYKSVTLYKGKKHKHVSIHRIVAEAFCKKHKSANEVNHINGNKLDNRAENLEWVTRGDNLKHAYRTGLMPNDASPRPVVATNMKTGEQMTFPSIYKAARFFDISQGNICMCCKKTRPFASGFYWNYLQEGE